MVDYSEIYGGSHDEILVTAVTDVQDRLVELRDSKGEGATEQDAAMAAGVMFAASYCAKFGGEHIKNMLPVLALTILKGKGVFHDG